jgi:ParB-like chromosome segregation protein Spo0J
MKTNVRKLKPDPVAVVLRKATGKPIGPYRKISIAECVPNAWNPNVMAADTREKLTRGIKLVLDAVGVIPPIIVRPHPDPAQARWQIIDGQHRWDILREEGHERIDAYVIDVDTKTAMLLTDTLNYLRGEADPDRYVKYYQSLLTETHMTVAEAAEYLPETADEITELLDNYDITIEHLKHTEDDGTTKELDESDQFVEVKFLLAKEQQEVVEAELARVGAFLQGKNIRGRALEMICVNSSLTPTANLTGEEPDEPKRKKKHKKKRRAVA